MYCDLARTGKDCSVFQVETKLLEYCPRPRIVVEAACLSGRTPELAVTILGLGGTAEMEGLIYPLLLLCFGLTSLTINSSPSTRLTTLFCVSEQMNLSKILMEWKVENLLMMMLTSFL